MAGRVSGAQVSKFARRNRVMIIGGRRWGKILMVGCLAAVLGAAGCKTTPPEEVSKKEEPTGPHASLLKLFPGGQDVTDWKPAGKVEVFGPAERPDEGVRAIEADEGGTATVTRAYGYMKSGLCRYERAGVGESVKVRIFEMESPQEAFGLFSVRATGEQFPMVGLAARMGAESLGFVKGPYFVWIEYDGTREAAPALTDFARWVADQVTKKGYRPAILESFPLGSAQGERYYLHRFETLALLEFVPIANSAELERALGLGPQTEVAIMGYPTTQTGMMNYLFVIRYPTAEDAKAAYEAYQAYLDRSTDPAEQNVAIAPPVQSYLAGTLNAEENSIRDRLTSLLAGLGA